MIPRTIQVIQPRYNPSIKSKTATELPSICMKQMRERESIPVTSFGVLAHGRNLKSWSQVHAPVIPLFLVRTTEESGYGSGLSGFLEAAHEPHRLPIEVVLALHREQGVYPPRSFSGLPLPGPATDHTQPDQHHNQTHEIRH